MEPWERSGGCGVKGTKTSPAPPVAALGDDLLGEILLCLPDMASLASAALVCKSWGRVARVPAIFRRFGSLRRPQLVGFILAEGSDMNVPYHRPNLCFISAKSRNPDAASAAADGDFFLEDLPDIDPAGDEGSRRYDDQWRLHGCDGGLLLLARGRAAVELAVYNPLARTAIFFRVPSAWRDCSIDWSIYFLWFPLHCLGTRNGIPADLAVPASFPALVLALTPEEESDAWERHTNYGSQRPGACACL